MEPLTKGRIELHHDPYNKGFYCDVAVGGIITSLLNERTKEAAIDAGVEYLRTELKSHLDSLRMDAEAKARNT